MSHRESKIGQMTYMILKALLVDYFLHCSDLTQYAEEESYKKSKPMDGTFAKYVLL